jgi:hypothetical protein
MPKRRPHRKPARRGARSRRHDAPIDPGHVYRYRCDCCGEVTSVKGSNLLRLAAAAEAADVTIELVIDELPEADWTADVPEEIVAAAVALQGRPREDT